MDPVSLTLEGLHLLRPVFEAGRAIYDGWQKAQSFPADIEWLSAQLNLQYGIFHQKADYSLDDCKIKFDQLNTMILLRYLEAVLDLFRACDAIIDKYKPRDHPSISTATSENTPTVARSQVPDVQPDLNTVTKPKIASKSPWGIFKKNKAKKIKKQATTTEHGPRSQQGFRQHPNVPGLEEEHQLGKQRLAENATVSTWHRLPWVMEDKEELKTIIKLIKEANRDLDDFLQIKQPQSWQSLCPKISVTSGDPDTLSQKLERLHVAVRQLNSSGKKEGPFPLSIGLQDDPQSSRQELATRMGKQPRPDTDTYFLQRHSSSELDDLPLTIAIVALAAGKPPSNGPLLECLAKTPSSNESIEGMAYWGHFRDESNYGYEVYNDEEAPWHSITTLNALIQEQSYQTNVKPYQVLQLARLLAIAYSSFSNVYKDLKNPRLEQIRFYRAKSKVKEEKQAEPEADTDDWWDDEDPLILHPWLFFGFGERSPRRPIGTGRTIQLPRNASLVELGLVLYQLATGRILTYSRTVTGCIDAQREALSHLTSIDRTLGPGLSIIIKACLDWPEPDPLLSTSDVDRMQHEAFSAVILQLDTLAQLAIGVNSPVFAITVEQLELDDPSEARVQWEDTYESMIQSMVTADEVRQSADNSREGTVISSVPSLTTVATYVTRQTLPAPPSTDIRNAERIDEASISDADTRKSESLVAELVLAE